MICHRQESCDNDDFSIFAPNSAIASIAFRDIHWQLLRIPLFLSLFLYGFGFSPFQNIFVRCSESLLLSFAPLRIVSFVFFRSSVRFSFLFFLAFPILAFGLFGASFVFLSLFFIFIQSCALLLGPSALLAYI